MKGAVAVSLVALAAAVASASMAGCLTLRNNYQWKPLADAPAVTSRPENCNVEVFEDGEAVARPHQDLGRIALTFSASKLKEQGPEAAVATLRAAACEKGAFIVKDLRALTTGQKGLVYEATLATLLGDDGRPLNLDAPGNAANRPAAAEPAGSSTGSGG